MENLENIPQLRFPEFEGEWEKKKLGDVAKRIVTKNQIGIDNVLTISAQFGLISQLEFFNKSVSAKDVSGYYLLSKDDFAYNKSYSNGYPMGAIKRLTRYEKGVVSTLYICFRNSAGFDNSFAEQYFETGNQNTEIEKVAQEGARNHGLLNIGVNDFFNIELTIPTLPEQTRIASFFTAVDKKISELQKKKTLLEQYKKGVMQKLFSQELRFKDEDGREFPGWDMKRLGEVTRKVGQKNKNNIKFPIYSINNKDGFIPQSEQFEGMDSNERGYDISMYKIIEKKTFAYNPARINVGSIGYSGKLENIIISSLYVCFQTKDLIDDSFLFIFLKGSDFNKSVLRSVEGGVRDYLFYENFSRITIELPSLPEQTKIANFLTAIDEKIYRNDNQIRQMQEWKKGLLQRMFC